MVVNQLKNYYSWMLLPVKKSLLLALFLIPIVVLKAAGRYTINEAWRFSLVDKPGNQLRSCDDSKWKIINLPYTWNRLDAADDVPGYYRGVGWYRKNLFIDSTTKGKITSIYFDGANQVTELYVNEKKVGTHKGGYTRFSFDISDYIVPGTTNLIAIKVDNSLNTSIPPLTADFTFFGGIYRNLFIEVKEKTALSVGDFASDGIYISTRSVNNKRAVVEVQTLLDNRVDNNSTVQIIQTIIDPNGREIYTVQQPAVLPAKSLKTTFTKEFTIEEPLLWSPDSPRLYLLKTVIRDVQTGKELDSQLNSFGLRWFHFDADSGFSLNGKHLKLIGTNRHQCYTGMGNALPDELHVEDIRLLKEMGGNMLRVSHYPQDPLILEMCDKLGIIASVEIPIVNEITESDEFLDNSLQMATEMVKQNFNHPSVVIWAYMNEVMLRPPFLNDSVRYKQYCHEVHRQATEIDSLLRKLDPGRYTMIPFHGSLKRYEETDLIHVPMIVGWNLYQGWYSGTLDDFDRFLTDYHDRYPSIPTIITEYGADVDDRLHSFKPERFDFTVEYGDLYHEHYLKTILRNNYIAGATIWNLNDFYSEGRTDAVPHVNTKGITSGDRQLKNTYLLYKVALLKEPMAYIGSKSWAHRAGTDNGKGVCWQPLKIYSNQPKVDVYQNGAFFKQVDIADHYVDLELPFTNGKNTLELRVGNKTFDFAEINFKLMPVNIINKGIDEINVMLGSNRYFEDRDARIVWIPEQPYTRGSWGYIGGKPVRPKTKSGFLPFTSLDIRNTDNDPIFQTQREGIQSFRLDVPVGQYAVYLYWADLVVDSTNISVYNLGNNAVNKSKVHPVMNIQINSRPVLTHFALADHGNTANAIIKKIPVNVMNEKGITVDFDPVEGKTVLNAIRVIKLN